MHQTEVQEGASRLAHDGKLSWVYLLQRAWTHLRDQTLAQPVGQGTNPGPKEWAESIDG